jgi:SAM-dependent methyltransferase
MMAPDELQVYDASYYSSLRRGMQVSAQRVAPILVDLFAPRSVVDVGCGPGEWLAAFLEQGVDDVLGIDGAHIDPESLAIAPEQFLAHDLCRPLQLERRFDLVLCLEVAEHLPAEAADVLVESLTGLGDVVVFSAAIPHQGGEHHINEQWPQYWGQRFQDRGYALCDIVRWQVWNDPQVEWWYAQNMTVFTAAGRLEQDLSRSAPDPEHPLPVVHPRLYLELCDERRQLQRQLWTARKQLLEQTIARVIPPGARSALLGGECLGRLEVGERQDVTARVGPYPAAVAELAARAEACREGEPLYLVLAWPCFWLLERASESEKDFVSQHTVLANDACHVLSLE